MTDVHQSKPARAFSWLWKLSVAIAGVAITYYAYEYTIERDEPVLMLTEKPRLVGVWWGSVPMQISTMKSQNRPDSLIKPIVIPFSPESLKVALVFKNKGSNIARVWAYAIGDTVSFQPTFLNHIRNYSPSDSAVSIGILDRLYELPQGESKIVPYTFHLSGVSDDQMILHFVILYKGRLDILRYTYYWASYKYVPNLGARVQDTFVFTEEQQSYGVFSSEEANRFLITARRQLELQDLIKRGAR